MADLLAAVESQPVGSSPRCAVAEAGRSRRSWQPERDTSRQVHSVTMAWWSLSAWPLDDHLLDLRAHRLEY
ncbi:hypothetical protein ACBJ59_52355 [Nonomuraea sp. MTCD27]|uniref:hypothetical protein n=1 Tax=Nonomuraea sp. MTCD27 TaxID=1676747 RepID=UPI0035C22EC6